MCTIKHGYLASRNFFVCIIEIVQTANSFCTILTATKASA